MTGAVRGGDGCSVQLCGKVGFNSGGGYQNCLSAKKEEAVLLFRNIRNLDLDCRVEFKRCIFPVDVCNPILEFGLFEKECEFGKCASFCSKSYERDQSHGSSAAPCLTNNLFAVLAAPHCFACVQHAELTSL